MAHHFHPLQENEQVKNSINWDRWRQGWNGSKRVGNQIEGPCSLTGQGENCQHVNLDSDLAGCRKCGDGSGRLTGDLLVDHARAAEAVHYDIDLGRAGGAWESWTWITADGRERPQYRTPDGKRWRIKDPPAGGWPEPADLMYLPGGALPAAPVVYACEGASDADAVHAAGLPALGRNNARPSAESLARLDKSAVYRIWPDHDADGAGYKQAATFADAATAAGLRVKLIDPLILRPDAPSGFDARDWLKQPPEDMQAALDAAVVDAETIRARIPAAPRMEPVSTPAQDADDELLPIARQQVDLCASEEAAAKVIARRAGGRLAYIHQTGECLTFGPRGWQQVHRTAIEEACADFAQWNIGSLDKKTGKVSYSPRSTGRKSVGRAITQLLEPMVGIGTEFSDWDAAGNLIMLPDGSLLDVFTGQQRPSVPADRIRRRVPVAPATEDDFNRSFFRYVLDSLIPDAAEREYLQRRLGAALVNAEGMHDLIWLFGPPGAGKGTLLEALRLTFGDHGRGVPAAELIKGRPHDGHSAWKARLAGARVLFADDVPTGHQLEDSTINALLGSVITARHMRQAAFDFRLHAPLLVTSNGEPRQATSNVRRLKPIECGPAPSEDPNVQAAMSTPAERAACLHWLCVGAFLFARDRCPVPESIRARARDVAADAPIVVFTESFTAGERYRSGDVWKSWQTFAQAHGCAGLAKNQTNLATLLRAQGWRTSKSGSVRYLTAPRPVQGTGWDGSLFVPIEGVDHSRANTTSNPSQPVPTPPTPSLSMFPAGALGRADDGGGVENNGAGGVTEPSGFSSSPPPDGAAASVEEASVEEEHAPADAEPSDDDRGQYLGILPADETCGACAGTGRQGRRHCQRCGGSGLRPDNATCPRCFGTGKRMNGEPCRDCQPLAVFLDHKRPLPADELQRAQDFMERLRQRAGAEDRRPAPAPAIFRATDEPTVH